MTARPRRSPSPWLGAALMAAVSVVATANVLQVNRLRRAGGDAVDLDHDALVGEGLGDPIRLLVLGDSAARGHGLTDPGEAFPSALGHELARHTGRRVRVACLATDGHRTADVVTTQVPLVRAHDPDVVVASVGVNDAIRFTPGRRVRDDTAELAVALSQLPASDTALVTCPDLGGAPGFPQPLRWLVGARCRRVARAQRRGAQDADTDVAVVTPGAVQAAHYGADGFHPSAAGQAALARRVADLLMPSGVAPDKPMAPAPRP